jgi:UDP-2-acetamido-3-amino-2,3-dideoxy-glucuronate N-acetyltransferase
MTEGPTEEPTGPDPRRDPAGGRLDDGLADAPFVHPSATVEGGASLGRGTRVWHHAHIRAGAIVGAGCTIGKNVFVDAGAVVGDGVKIQNNVSVYAGVTLEDEVFVGPSAVFTNDLRPRAAATEWQLTPTLVRRGASIGANATVVCGNEIGAEAMVGSGAVVARDVEPNELVVGNPARRIGWVCACGDVISREVERPTDVRCAAHRDRDRDGDR